MTWWLKTKIIYYKIIKLRFDQEESSNQDKTAYLFFGFTVIILAFSIFEKRRIPQNTPYKTKDGASWFLKTEVNSCAPEG